MSGGRTWGHRPDLFVVPTPVGGTLPEADLDLFGALAERYRLTVFATLEHEPAFSADTVLREPLWLRPLLRERGAGPRLLYVLRADASQAYQSLGLCERHPGVVLHSGGGLLDAYRQLYLYRDDGPDFDAELGRQMGSAATGILSGIKLGIGPVGVEDRALMLTTLAEKSLAILTPETAAIEALQRCSAPNRRRLLPSPYSLASDPDFVAGGPCLTLFGDTIPDPLVEQALRCQKVLARRGLELQVLVAEIANTPRGDLAHGAQRIRPSIELLRSSSAVVAVPEGRRTAFSAALATCLQLGAATIGADANGESEARGSYVPIRWPVNTEELWRSVERLVSSPRLRELLSLRARETGVRFPSVSTRAAELSSTLELCQWQRPDRLERHRVWQDVLGIRHAVLTEMTLRPHDPEARRLELAAARELQGWPGGDE